MTEEDIYEFVREALTPTLVSLRTERGTVVLPTLIRLVTELAIENEMPDGAFDFVVNTIRLAHATKGERGS